MIASPTLTSAAATTIIKKTKICASLASEGNCAATPDKCILENATNNKLTELSMSSMHINMMIALRRVKTPTIPIQKSANDKNIYHFISIVYSLTYNPTPMVTEAGLSEKISFIFLTAIPLKTSTAL